MRGYAVWAFVGFLLSAVIATVPTHPRAEVRPQTDTTSCKDKKLCIGVRSYARPFSYKPTAKREIVTDGTFGPLAKLGYTGYIVRICDAVLKEMTLDVGDDSEHLQYTDIGVFDVDSYNIPESASATEPPTADGPRFNGMGQEFDILCDPATISNERRSGLTVSSPLFLTGISYITPPRQSAPRNACAQDRSLIGVVRGTNAVTHGLKTLVKAHELPEFEKELTDYLKGRKPCEDENNEPHKDESDEPLVKVFINHEDAAKAFCNNKFFYYVGDLEVIIENARAISGCDYENGSQTYTTDRYAIFGKPISDDDIERRLRVARFFEILGRKTVFTPSILDDAFNSTFYGMQPSEKLDVFYQSIRGIPDQR